MLLREHQLARRIVKNYVQVRVTVHGALSIYNIGCVTVSVRVSRVASLYPNGQIFGAAAAFFRVRADDCFKFQHIVNTYVAVHVVCTYNCTYVRCTYNVGTLYITQRTYT